jgi:hypothetical protein
MNSCLMSGVLESLVGIDGVRPLYAAWATATFAVEWIGGDWKLASIDPYTSASDGPTPLSTQVPVQTPQLPAQLKDFKPYGHDLSP